MPSWSSREGGSQSRRPEDNRANRQRLPRLKNPADDRGSEQKSGWARVTRQVGSPPQRRRVPHYRSSTARGWKSRAGRLTTEQIATDCTPTPGQLGPTQIRYPYFVARTLRTSHAPLARWGRPRGCSWVSCTYGSRSWRSGSGGSRCVSGSGREDCTRSPSPHEALPPRPWQHLMPPGYRILQPRRLVSPRSSRTRFGRLLHGRPSVNLEPEPGRHHFPLAAGHHRHGI
jgi:hypothetical protein